MLLVLFHMPLRIQLDKAGQKEALAILADLNSNEPYMNEAQKKFGRKYKDFQPFQKTEEFDIIPSLNKDAALTVSNSPDAIEIYSSAQCSSPSSLYFESDDCDPALVNIFTNIVKYMKTQDLPDVYQATGTIDTVKNPFA